ncbi:response regulator [Trichocoleus sp. FACHB-262]|uniref:response regulator n=1 Tax=Trichocoleus sp. FACHB-262 TaxID=2692869 RepID=UPI001684A271|nr:response regulator [Trichocoleus sp. FACHB-262]MBD2124485.1 response regulator [Trichocoleus sp. FACHB-262]
MQSEQQQRIMGYFIEEAKDHLNTIEQGLLNLQSTIEDSEMVNEVFRAAHSVKGGAAMLGINSIQQVSHRLEDCFKLLKECPIKVDQKLESLFLRVFDTLHELLEQLQGPFGLTEDIANGIMSGIEPIFTELTNHLEGLITQAGGVIPAEEGSSFIPVVVEATPIPVAAAPLHQEESALLLLFQSDVPTRLREMLQLFKQSESSENRKQLQDLCRSLGQLGEPFDLPNWCNLLEVSRQAIACPDNAYRTLAPIVIKEIKKAQELVLANQAATILAGDALTVLVPISAAEAATEPTFDDLLDGDLFELTNQPEESLTEAFDLFETAEEPTSDDIFAVDLTEGSPSDGLEDWFSSPALEPDAVTNDADLGLDLSSDLNADLVTAEQATGDRNGPEVGMAELNSLADLFEGEVLDLGVTWQEEEIIRETAESADGSLESDVNSDDFSDLLFDAESSGNSSSKARGGDDLASLFGSDDLLNDESLDFQGLEDFTDASLDSAAAITFEDQAEEQPDLDFFGDLESDDAAFNSLGVEAVEDSIDTSADNLAFEISESSFELSEFEVVADEIVVEVPSDDLGEFPDLFAESDESELLSLKTSSEELTNAAVSDDFTDFFNEPAPETSLEGLGDSEPDFFSAEPTFEPDAELEAALEGSESIGLFGEESPSDLEPGILAEDEADLTDLFGVAEEPSSLDAADLFVASDDTDNVSDDLWSEETTDSAEPGTSWLDAPMNEVDDTPLDLSLAEADLAAEPESLDFSLETSAEADLDDLFATSSNEGDEPDVDADAPVLDLASEEPVAAIADPWEEQGLTGGDSEPEASWNLDALDLDEALITTPEATRADGEDPFAIAEQLESLDFDLETENSEATFTLAPDADEELLLEELTDSAASSDWSLTEVSDRETSDELNLALGADESLDLWSSEAFDQTDLNEVVADTGLNTELDESLLLEEPTDDAEFADLLAESELSDRSDDLGFDLSSDETNDLWGDNLSSGVDLEELSLATPIAATESVDDLGLVESFADNAELADLLTESSEFGVTPEEFDFELASSEATDLWPEAVPSENDLAALNLEETADLSGSADDPLADFSVEANFADLTTDADELNASSDELDFDLMGADEADESWMPEPAASLNEVSETTVAEPSLFDEDLSPETVESNADLGDLEDFMSESLEARDANSDFGGLNDPSNELLLDSLPTEETSAFEDFSFESAVDTSDELDFGDELTPAADLGDLFDEPSEPEAEAEAIALDLGSFDDFSLDSLPAEAPEPTEDFSFESVADTSDELNFDDELALNLDSESNHTQLDALSNVELDESSEADFAFDLDTPETSLDESELGFDSLLDDSELDLTESLAPVEPSLGAESELDFGDELALGGLFDGEETSDNLSEASLFDEEESDSLNEVDLFDEQTSDSLSEASISESIDSESWLEGFDADEADAAITSEVAPDLASDNSDEFGAFFQTESVDTAEEEAVDLFADSPTTESTDEFGFDALDLSGLPVAETTEFGDAFTEVDAELGLEDDVTTSTESAPNLTTESSFDFDEVDLDLFDLGTDAVPEAADVTDTSFGLEDSEAADLNDFDLFALDSTDNFSHGLDLGQAQASADTADVGGSDLDDFLAIASEEDSFDGNFEHDTAPADSLDNFDDLEALLSEDDFAAPPSISEVDKDDADFSGLEALLDEESFGSVNGLGASAFSATASGAGAFDGEFDDLEKLLEDADKTLGGPPTVKTSRGAAPQANRRPGRRGGAGFAEQTMRVPVKHLDNLSNLVGELVVNRNSLEQDQERLRQFLDNLLYQVQQLSDVGQRMRDLYERSLLESSLLASRQSHHAPVHGSNGDAQNSHSTGASFDALEMDRFTGFHTLSQEMIELIVRVRESASDIEFIVDETDQVTRMFRQVTTQLQEGLTRSRMVPFAQIADRLPRAVRDIALKCGKQAELHVEGRETLIDKMILEQLYDPMTHLVNNAIAHGIETPDVRQAAGKPSIGRITIRAFHQGNQTVISVSDDGAGVDPDRVKTKAIEKRLVTPAEARTLSRLDVYDLLFHPGFTTKDQVTDYAGRGVGMDVVRTSLGEIRGAITTDSAVAKGTTFTIRLPLTLSISKALCCISNRARIAFPMDGVEDMLDVPKERIQANPDGQPCILWRDLLLPFRPLSDILKYNRYLGRGSVYGGNQEDDIVSIVVLRSAGNFIALQVDQVLGEQEIVIKQLEGPVPKPIGVAGATVLGDGRIMPIADVLELIDLSMGRIRREASTTLWDQNAEPPVAEAVAKTDPTVLIVDDSITVRELLSMTFNKVGYRVEQARDGQEAWEKLRSGLPCDMVFCDIEMPRMDGLELLSRIQKDSTLNHIPIAMLTSRGADRHRQMAVQLGAKGYFTKPYLEEALLDAAQRMLKGEVLIAGSGSHA